MGQRESSLQPRVLGDLMRMTDFTDKELHIWYNEFQKDADNQQLTRSKFKKIFCSIFPGNDATEFADHVFRTFDANKDGVLNFREFVTGLSLSLRGSFDEKLYWSFNIYDVDGNGFISREEMNEIIAAMRAICKEKEGIEFPDANFFEAIDVDHDGKVSWAEFRNVFHRDKTTAQYLWKAFNCVINEE